MSDDKTIPHYNVHTTHYDPLPEFDGGQAVLYKSPDGKRLAGSFKEKGTHKMKMPFDEFIYLIAGGCTITVEGGETVVLKAGDACYLREGQVVTFEMTDDFHDVTVLISDTAFNHVPEDH